MGWPHFRTLRHGHRRRTCGAAARRLPAAIEVYVVDEETSLDAGSGQWVEATPLERVIDPGTGHDTTIRVEYFWDDECYEEEFGPDRVRIRGCTSTVRQQLLSEAVAAKLGSKAGNRSRKHSSGSPTHCTSIRIVA